MSLIPFGVYAADAADTPAKDIREVKLNVPIQDLKLKPVTEVECGKDAQGKPITCYKITWIADYLGAVFKYLLAIGSVVAVLMIMWGGVGYILSGANIQLIQSNKDKIVAGLTGMLLMMGTYLIVSYVNPELTKMKAINVPKVKKIPFICCESLETKERQYVFNFDKQKTDTDKEPNCPQGTRKVSLKKCQEEGTMVFGMPCCLDENSKSNQLCKTIGGMCLKIKKSTCEKVAEVVAALSSSLVGIGVSGSGISGVVFKQVVKEKLLKEVVTGLAKRIVVAIGRKGAKYLFQCPLNLGTCTIFVSAVGATAENWEYVKDLVSVVQDLFGDDCQNEDNTGICSEIGINKAGPGDACIADSQCPVGMKCCYVNYNDPLISCWKKEGIKTGHCRSGMPGPAGKTGTSNCFPESNCCIGNSTCAKYETYTNYFYSCSLGEIGHACGGNEKICKTGLKCSEEGICVPNEKAFIPKDVFISCDYHSHCNKYFFAFCNGNNDVNCLNFNNLNKPGCVDKPTGEGAFCVNQYELGEDCVDDDQCLSGDCETDKLFDQGKERGRCECNKKEDCPSGFCVEVENNCGWNYCSKEKVKSYHDDPKYIAKGVGLCEKDEECASGDCVTDLGINNCNVCDCSNDSHCDEGFTCVNQSSLAFDGICVRKPKNTKK